jgi:hypothetical protein
MSEREEEKCGREERSRPVRIKRTGRRHSSITTLLHALIGRRVRRPILTTPCFPVPEGQSLLQPPPAPAPRRQATPAAIVSTLIRRPSLVIGALRNLALRQTSRSLDGVDVVHDVNFESPRRKLVPQFLRQLDWINVCCAKVL